MLFCLRDVCWDYHDNVFPEQGEHNKLINKTLKSWYTKSQEIGEEFFRLPDAAQVNGSVGTEIAFFLTWVSSAKFFCAFSRFLFRRRSPRGNQWMH